MSKSLVDYIDRYFYPEYGSNWDDEHFRQIVLDQILPHMVVLDLGAGAGVVRQMDFRGRCSRICGVDPDPRVADNPYLDEARVGTGECIPYEDATFDLVLADNVLEHLVEPAAVFAEVRRVLRPRGLFLFKTPNSMHYVALLARLTPHGLHGRLNRWRGRRGEADFFPTMYRANNPREVRKLAQGAGLAVESLQFVEGRPEYLRLSAPTYLLGLAYERLVNSSALLARFRVVLIGTLRARSDAHLEKAEEYAPCSPAPRS